MVKIEDGGLGLDSKLLVKDFAFKEQIPAFFELMCPNCFFGISSYRLHRRHACDFCVGDLDRPLNEPIELGDVLFERGELKKFKPFFDAERMLEDFDDFFKLLTGSNLWSAQKVWARRVFNGQSSAIIAPTGVGKTVFGLVLTLFFAHRLNRYSYVVLPTTTLLRQIIDKLEAWEAKLGRSYVVYFHSGLTKKQKERFTERLENGDFKVLVTTSQFLVRNMQKIINAFQRAKGKTSGPPVDFLFVDDVDSFLRNPKNLDRALSILGFTHFRKVREVLDKIKKAFLPGGGGFFKLSEEDWNAVFEARRKSGQLVVSSATGKVGSATVRRIFSILFGFSIGSSKEGIRNVIDAYDSEFLSGKFKGDPVDRVVDLVKKFGSGGLIFISRGAKSDQIIEDLQEKLNGEGINALGITAEDSRNFQKVIEDYRSGKIDILIGKASPYGLLVRGLDLPERIKYAIFLEVPHYSIKLEIRPNPIYLSFVLRRLSPILANKRETVEKIRELASQSIWLKRNEVKEVEEELLGKLEKGQDISVLLEEYKSKIDESVEDHRLNTIIITLELCKILNDFLKNNPVEKLEKSRIPFDIKEEDGKQAIYILTADIKTYIQASGRTSRLYAGGVTKGLSVVISNNETLVKELDTKLMWSSDSNFVAIEDLNLDEVLREIEEDRKNVLLAWEGKIPTKGHLQTCLFIVESPTKAKTIANFFGRPSRRFLPGIVAYEIIMGRYLATIVATMGHITELVTHKFIPIFGYERLNGKLVPTIKGYKVEELEWPYGIALAKENGKIRYTPIFGPRVTCNSCGYTFIPYFSMNLKDRKLSEKVFKFLRHPDGDYTNIERLFGKTLLPLKCPRCGESVNLFDRAIMLESLRRIAAENEMVIIGTDPDIEGEKIAWDLALLLNPYAKEIKRAEFHEVTRTAIETALSELRDIDLNLVKGQLLRRIEDRWIGFYLSMKLRNILDERNLSAGRVQSPVLDWIIEAYEKWKQKEDYTVMKYRSDLEIRIKGKVKPIKIKVLDVSVSEREVYPHAPLVTDTLLNFASNLYGLSANDTMRNAQKLFETGLITYIRTDSTRVSNLGLYIGKKLVVEEFGEDLYVGRTWTKKDGEGAHECIRPTKPLMLHELKEIIERGELSLAEELSADALNVYDLIVRFFMASQMKEAKVKTVEYKLEVEYEKDGKIEKEQISVNGYTSIIQRGFLAALTPKMRKFVMPPKLPKLDRGDIIDASDLKLEQIKLPKGRLPTEGDIVRMMKERGLGRPSTYANIIAKLKERQYVKLIANRFLAPKTRGMIVNRILERLNRDMVSEERTRIILKQIDEVAEGKIDYEELLNEIHLEILKDMNKKINKSIWAILPEDLKGEIETYKMKRDKRKIMYNNNI